MGKDWKKAMEGFRLIFGRDPKLKDFDERLTFQKTNYLLKRLGVQFEKLDFTWYHRGPFSFEIWGTRAPFEKNDAGLSEEEKQLVLKHKTVLATFLQKPDDAELYSSVAFLALDEKLDEEKTVHKMSLMKPWFNAEQVKEARKKIIEFFGQPA